MENEKQPTKEEIRAKLRARIGEKRIQRSSKVEKEKVLDQTFKQMGVDKAKFEEAMKLLKKSNPQQRQQILQQKMEQAAKE